MSNAIEELLPAADAVVKHWEIYSWKDAATPDYIERLSKAKQQAYLQLLADDAQKLDMGYGNPQNAIQEAANRVSNYLHCHKSLFRPNVIADAFRGSDFMQPTHHELRADDLRVLSESVMAADRQAPVEDGSIPDVCRDDGRCQYAIDHGAEGLGACPIGKCCMSHDKSARQQAPVLPPAIAVSRDADSPGMTGVLITFARPLSDGQLREIHEYLNRNQP